ncbi:MAG TPA: helix-turn-helix domain-containing protein [Xanthobacteraceae bacterium]|jgi:DNA-binding IclR family transcriptional regulator|nr:helix-turn-helix domain-containing protein [Xanthobacteraceae bacterium]
MARDASDSSVRSATRAFEILEYFEEVRRPLRLKEIAARYGYPPSSASDLLKTMTARGYLSFEQSHRAYFPTARLAALVGWMTSASFEDGPVKRAMNNLARATRELVVVATPVDIYIEFCHTLRSTHDIQLWREPGTRRLLVQTGIGMLYLSRLSHPAHADYHLQQATKLYRRTLAARKIKERDFSLKELLAHVKRLRTQDYAFRRSSDYRGVPPGEPGVGMVSMCVPCPPNHRPLILGVGGPAERMSANLDFILKEMRREISAISDSLAHGDSIAPGVAKAR